MASNGKKKVSITALGDPEKRRLKKDLRPDRNTISANQLLTFILTAVLLLFVTNAGTSFAQSGASSTLVGNVTDVSGAIIPGAKISITYIGTNATQNTVTSSTGTYAVPSLKPGAYRIEASSPGFATKFITGVELVVGQESRVDIQMQPGTVNQTVNVSGGTVNLDTENAAVGQVVTQAEIVDLPLNGRNFTQLLLLDGGAVSNSGEQGAYRIGEGNALTIQGTRPDSNQYFLDGIDINDTYYQTPAVVPSIDALQEFQEQTNSYSAAYGGGANQINLSTKSGTNDLHGTVFDFLRNDALDARNFFDTSIPPLRQNQFGYVLGGPVIIPKIYNGKNKSFFLANYEGLRSETSGTLFASVPTVAERSGLFPTTEVITDPITKVPYPGNQIPQSQFSTFGKAVLSNNLFPAPNVNLPQGNYRGVLGLSTDSDQQTYRFDQTLGTKDTFFVRYTQTEVAALSGGPFVQSLATTAQTSHGVALNWTRTFSPNAVNQFRYGWIREVVLISGVPTTEAAYNSFGLTGLYPYEKDLNLPQISARNGQFTGAGGQYAAPEAYTQPSNQISDVFSLNKGAHSVSFGLDARWLWADTSELINPNFVFDGSFTGDPFADLLVGYAASAQASQPTSYAPTVATALSTTFHERHIAPWIQDDWKATPRLTLNAGLRYDFSIRPYESDNKMFWLDSNVPGGGLYAANKSIIDQGLGGTLYQYGGQDSPGKTNWFTFAPRIGFAYRPSFDEKSVVRAGYGIFFDSTEAKEANGGTNYPFDLETTNTFVNLSTQFPPVPPLGPVTPSLLGFLFLTTPNVHSPYIQRWTLSTEREILPGFKAEVDYLGAKATHLVGRVLENAPTPYDPSNPTPASARIPYSNLGEIIDHFWDFYSNYNALSLKLDHNGKNLSLISSYTWSHSLDIKSADASLNTDEDGSGPMDEYNFNLDYGSSGFDIQQQFVGSFVYQLPFGREQKFLNNENTFTNILIGGWQVNGILTLQTGLPFSIYATDLGFVNQNYSQRADVVGKLYPSGFHRSENLWFNPAAFGQPALGAFGNSARNLVRAPGTENLDASIFKNIPLGERVRWQTRLEAFNSLNHTNLGFPQSTITAPTFGAIGSASPARVAQVAMKLIW